MKSNLEQAIILMGEIMNDENETIDNFDSKVLKDLSKLLKLEINSRNSRSFQ